MEVMSAPGRSDWTLRAAQIAMLVVSLGALAACAAHAQGLEAIERDVVRIVQKVRPACVLVRVLDRNEGLGKGGRPSRPFVERARLSGTVWDAGGTIVTLGAELSRAERVFVTFHDGEEYRASILSEDKDTTIGLLRVERARLAAPAWGDSDKLALGSFVVAVGNPFSFIGSPSLGIVSGLDREVEDADAHTAIRGMIQVTALVNPGDAGGPLANSAGDIVGLLASVFRRPSFWVAAPPKLTIFEAPGPALESPATPPPAPPTPEPSTREESLGAEGIGFAYPINAIRPAVEKLLKLPAPKPRAQAGGPWLGVQVEPIGHAMAAQLNLDEEAVLVTSVTRNGPAARAGLERYDVLLSLDGRPLSNVDQLLEVLNELKPGADVKASIRRNGKDLELLVKLEP